MDDNIHTTPNSEKKNSANVTPNMSFLYSMEEGTATVEASIKHNVLSNDEVKPKRIKLAQMVSYCVDLRYNEVKKLDFTTESNRLVSSGRIRNVTAVNAGIESNNIITDETVEATCSKSKLEYYFNNDTITEMPVHQQLNCTITSEKFINRPAEFLHVTDFQHHLSSKAMIQTNHEINRFDDKHITNVLKPGEPKLITSIDLTNLSDSDKNIITNKLDEEEYGTEGCLRKIKSCNEKKKKIKENPTYFSDLVDIFPNIDRNILHKLCASSLDLYSAIEKVLLFSKKKQNTVTQTLVEDEERHPTKGTVYNDSKKHDLSQNKQFITLKEILVDADPTYLENIFRNELHDDQDQINAFVIKALRKKNVPSIQELQAKRELSKQYKLYTKDFTVSGFLEEFPDPLHYFMKVNDGSSYRNISLDYLKCNFDRISVKLIREIFEKNNYNLTVTFLELSECPPNLQRRRYDNIDFKHTVASIKEVCFLQHKDEILNYLKHQVYQKQFEFILAKENRELLECSCCYNDEVIFENVVTCPEGHIFCSDCVKKSVETKIGEGVNRFNCLTECDTEFSLQTLESVLTTQLFSNIIILKQTEEIKAANIPDIENCPFCEFLCIPVPESTIFTCLNPKCGKESCRKCHEENHIPLRCDEIEKKEEINARTYIEDKMTEALVRNCYKCQKKYIKESGCNKIVCSCGALQCYICRKPVKGYEHFLQPHESKEINKCPLYSTEKALHVDAVVAAGLLAKESILDIELKHDPTKSNSAKYKNK